ncbi:MAG: M1 family metallopeptidase [Bellilinea sp.]
MRYCWKVQGIYGAVFMLLLASCQPVQPTVVPQSPTSTLGRTETQPDDALPILSSADAIAACDPEFQSKALRPDRIPDWDTLGVDTCYDLVFDLTSGSETYQGSAAITFTNPGKTALNEIVLRTFPNAPLLFGGGMEITSARASGESLAIEVFLEDQSAVRLPLKIPLMPGETIQLQLEFNGWLPVDFERDWIYGTYHYASDGPVVMLANAYPMLAPLVNGEWQASPVLVEGDAVVSSTALYRAQVQVPTGWQVAASGREVTREKTQSQISISIAGGPLRDFMLAASPALILREAEWGGIRVNHWGLPRTERYWNEAIDVAKASLDLFEETFGPLPYNELDIIAAPLKNASGVEYPGLILLGETLYNSGSVPHLLPSVTAHEVAHQWWYAVVGNDVLEYPWQDEALATLSAQFYEMVYDQNFYFGALENYKLRVETLEAASGEQAVSQSVADFSDNPQAYATVVYHKGYLFLEELRSQIGEQAFNAALQNYYQNNLYRLAPPAALLDSFETACSCELDELYNEWGVNP